MSEQNFIGIEIGGTKLQLVIADASLSIKDHLCLQVKQKNGATGIQRQIEDGILKLKSDQKLTAIGVGFGGPINHKTGIISTSHQIAGWDSFNLKAWLQEVSGVEAFIDNDANVAALGEAVNGAGATHDVVFYMTIGSGIGGGLVQNNKIYHGAFPGEVEVGHLQLNKNGQTLESLCSGWAVDEKIRATVIAEPNSLLANAVGHAKKGEAKFLKAALKKKDRTALKILEETADNLAFALSHVVHLFHPETIIIGGGLSLVGEDLIDNISLILPKYILKSFLPGPEIKMASLGEIVVPIGAIELAKYSFNNNNPNNTT
jgi:glucokinase